MYNNFRSLKSATISILILLSIFASFNIVSSDSVDVTTGEGNVEEPGKLRFFTFNSILSVSVDTKPLKEPLEIDSVTAVPVNVRYSTTLPPMLAGNMYGRFLLFGQFILIPPQVHYEIIQSESTITDWADVTFDTPDVLPQNIPFDGEEPVDLPTVNLLISPRREAPAVPQTISIRVSVDGLKSRLMGYSVDSNIKFEPAYVPEIEVYIDNPTRFSGPRESLEFKCTVKNKANKATTVLTDISSVDSDWAPTINPSKITLDPKAEEIITFSVVSPYTFGWHDETVSMNLKFTPYPAPISAGSSNYSLSLGQVVDAQVRINNRGFSFGGFEFVLLALIVILIVAVVIMIKKKK